MTVTSISLMQNCIGSTSVSKHYSMIPEYNYSNWHNAFAGKNNSSFVPDDFFKTTKDL